MDGALIDDCGFAASVARVDLAGQANQDINSFRATADYETEAVSTTQTCLQTKRTD